MIFKMKGKMFCRAKNLCQATMIFSNYFRDLAINITHNNTMDFENKILPESKFELGPDPSDEKSQYNFKSSGSFCTEIEDKQGYVIGIISYDTMKHLHYFMAKKKEKILIGDLIDIMNKICEMDKP